MNNDRLTECFEIANAIKNELIVQCDPQDGHGLTEKLSRLIALLPLSAFNVALTEQILNEKTAAVVASTNESNATRLKLLIQSETTREKFANTYAEQQAKELHYSIESIRSLISYLKTEMNNIHTT